MYSISKGDAANLIREFLEIGDELPALVSGIDGDHGQGVWFISIPQADKRFFHVRKSQEENPMTAGVSFISCDEEAQARLVAEVSNFSQYLQKFG